MMQGVLIEGNSHTYQAIASGGGINKDGSGSSALTTIAPTLAPSLLSNAASSSTSSPSPQSVVQVANTRREMGEWLWRNFSTRAAAEAVESTLALASAALLVGTYDGVVKAAHSSRIFLTVGRFELWTLEGTHRFGSGGGDSSFVAGPPPRASVSMPYNWPATTLHALHARPTSRSRNGVVRIMDA